MTDPLRYLVRKLMLHKHTSTVPTRIAPLADIHSALVFVDPMQEDAEATVHSVRQFFNYQGIPVNVILPQKTDINLIGMLKKRFRMEGEEPRHEDLFISLIPDPEYFPSEYEARCSTAFFKVGCQEYKGGVFDMIVTLPEGSEVSQSAIFAAIKDYLTKIK